MEVISDDTRVFRDRIRIFFILYFFSEEYNNPQFSNLKRVFKTEVKLQKLDFLVRNPDYLAYELLALAQQHDSMRTDVKEIVKNIFNTREPILRKLEMERFLFGAYEDLDDVIAFLDAFGLIKFDSNKDSRGNFSQTRSVRREEARKMSQLIVLRRCSSALRIYCRALDGKRTLSRTGRGNMAYKLKQHCCV